MRYCITGPSACSQLTESVVVVGSYTCMFLGPPRGTKQGRRSYISSLCIDNTSPCQCAVFQCYNLSVHSNTHRTHPLRLFPFKHFVSFNTVVQVLTCLSSVTDRRPLSVTVQSDNSNIVCSVWDQLLQQGCGGASWYQNLSRYTENIKRQNIWRVHYDRELGPRLKQIYEINLKYLHFIILIWT